MTVPDASATVKELISNLAGGSKNNGIPAKALASVVLVILLISIACGAGAWLFLTGLEIFTSWRVADGRWYLFAPLAGLLSGVWATVPRWLSPLIVVFTWISHLAGLSVGREGTAIQMGGGIAATFGSVFGFKQTESAKLLLQVGMACGFGAVFHVPVAAAVFALEVSRQRSRGFRLPTGAGAAVDVAKFAIYFLAALGADFCAGALGAQHAHYPSFRLSDVVSVRGIGACLVCGVFLGWVAWLFLFLLREFRKRYATLIPQAWLRPTLAGGVFSLMFFAPEVLRRYAGLGAVEIAQFFHTVPEHWDWFGKLAFTVFALGAGFKGGEVTPLFFIGASLGASTAGLVGLMPASLASLGMVAVFGAAARVPITCVVMAAELFGVQILPAAIPVCLIANWACRYSPLSEGKTD